MLKKKKKKKKSWSLLSTGLTVCKWWLCGLGVILSHTPKFNSVPEARPNKALWKVSCSAAVGWRTAPALKNNRKHMWWATGRDSRSAEQIQEPGSQDWDPTWPCMFPLTLPYPLHRAKGQDRGSRYRCWAQLQEASCMGTESGMEGMRGKGWWMLLYYLWYGPFVALSCLHNR